MLMKTKTSLLALLGAMTALGASAASRSSASYSVPADSADAGGRPATSASYASHGCIGGVGGIGTVVAPAQIAKHGYMGQLYEVSGLALGANPTTVDEGASRQLTARAMLDDATSINLGAATVSWSVVSGPINGISAAGLATAGSVYEHTPATVHGSFQSRVATLGLLVRNVGNDDYGMYAGDGLDDAWQVAQFGHNNPNAGPGGDPDGDGQNTGYEYVAGTLPLDGTSYFQLWIESVPGQPTHRNLVFSPRVSGRTYVPEFTLDLGSGIFDKLDGFSTTDIGPTRTITDVNATEPTKLYRVRITMP
jgi:hypothetical protein